MRGTGIMWLDLGTGIMFVPVIRIASYMIMPTDVIMNPFVIAIPITGNIIKEGDAQNAITVEGISIDRAAAYIIRMVERR